MVNNIKNDLMIVDSLSSLYSMMQLFEVELLDKILDYVRYRDRWILCSERLPDNDNMVLVTCKTQKGVLNVNTAYYWNGSWHGSGSMSGVIAWMPLPEPYLE